MSKRIKLSQLRRQAKLNHDEVAQKAGISRSHYTLIESGKRSPSLPVAIRIAEVIGCEVEDIFLADPVASCNNKQSTASESA